MPQPTRMWQRTTELVKDTETMIALCYAFGNIEPERAILDAFVENFVSSCDGKVGIVETTSEEFRAEGILPYDFGDRVTEYINSVGLDGYIIYLCHEEHTPQEAKECNLLPCFQRGQRDNS